LHQNGITKAKEVSPTTVIEFMKNLNCSTAYRSNILVTLRDFLRCPTISGLFQEGLANILTTIYSNRYERLPSVYSNEEVSRILLAVDRSTPQGKKDYAILILANELGLRASDIRKLQLDEINWSKRTCICQLKIPPHIHLKIPRL
jgi:integrase